MKNSPKTSPSVTTKWSDKQIPDPKNVILRIGVLAPLVEAAGIACACCFLFDMGIKMALTFGIILAATSPAVSIPAVLVLNKKGFGVPDGVPTVLLVCAAVDNIVLVTPFSVLLELLFNGDGLYTQIALIFAQIATGIALGLFSGFMLRYFPSINQPNYHFTRTAMLLALSMAFMYGSQATGWDSTGTVAVIIVSAVATLHWKTDNPEKVRKITL
ncbi:unnamed protein product [Anisakis simplex]|uniref:Na_H_Exchanger domain-containing protein n=1 Tax=Anisakis simplex TaxID=6269 RepID=A0A0M3KEL8_ANISI|nr:unnamed protein product [Anisakis simplex]